MTRNVIALALIGLFLGGLIVANLDYFSNEPEVTVESE